MKKKKVKPSANERTCLHCGLTFKANRRWQKFHSYDCQQAWHRVKKVEEAVFGGEP